MDSDMLFRVDISELVDQTADDSRAIHVVKHDYRPRDDIKYLNTVQYAYPRKNWSSFVVWNCGHPKNQALSPTFVEQATGLELHRFTWLADEDIGELDVRWNWLVGEYCDPPADVKMSTGLLVVRILTNIQIVISVTNGVLNSSA